MSRHSPRAETDDVMKAWAGLGYYSRARNLKKCADIVAGAARRPVSRHGGGLLELPGIGAYTAAAIAAIAFGRPAAVVDGNVERVITRLFDDRDAAARGEAGDPRGGLSSWCRRRGRAISRRR